MSKLFSRWRRQDDGAALPPAQTPRDGASASASSSPTSAAAAQSPPAAGAAPSAEPAADASAASPPPTTPPGGSGGSGGGGGGGSGGGSGGHDHPAIAGLTLDDITRGMQHAAAAANQMLAQQYTTLLDQFFDADEAGTLVAREVELALDTQHRLALPLVSLAMPRGLALEEMTVNMTVRSDLAEALPAEGTGAGGVGRFYVSLAPHSSREAGRDSEHIDIQMKFSALQPPEAVMRLIDEYTNRMVPRPLPQAKPGAEETADA
ncbi:DUF2589 domain-containing protein [uncultured Ralstonia sp.]|jgi:hypothetical protein|uniref:DUF2589 domain-containing protein n=2 Tax=Ralstonia TaxID=48736 RepID=UPI001EA7DFE3|nr:DUF2589 domain-containing protein [uncultured Ralstonia sp.]UCF22617.1 MAG: DUF2589 domain-containing protein [Ralstonia sp.]